MTAVTDDETSFGDLRFNDETGEWYTIGKDVPVDAQGNPINPSDITTVTTGSTNWLKGITDLFKGGGAGQLLALGGIGTLLSKMLGGGSGGGGFSGYQGGIPSYTATRTQTPLAQQRPTTTDASGATVPYRPGQGGITYFTPMQYTATQAPTTTQPPGNAAGGFMPSGIAMLAGGGQGGRYLRGPGDGVSDSIPAKFEGSGRPARLADGEFVIDARTVSEIGNGSSDAGARKLYAMMERVHKARKQAKRGEPSSADKYLPK